jgi:hypothetical protein
MKRHYKKRCGQGKATLNPFLMVPAAPAIDSAFRKTAGIDKSVSIQPLSYPMRKRARVRKFFSKKILTATWSAPLPGEMNRLWITFCNAMKNKGFYDQDMCEGSCAQQL